MLCIFLRYFMHVWLQMQSHTYVKQLFSLTCKLSHTVKSLFCCWLDTFPLCLPLFIVPCTGCVQKMGISKGRSKAKMVSAKTESEFSVTYYCFEQGKNAEGVEGTKACLPLGPASLKPQLCWQWSPITNQSNPAPPQVRLPSIIPGLRTLRKVSRRQNPLCLEKGCASSTPWDFTSPVRICL